MQTVVQKRTPELNIPVTPELLEVAFQRIAGVKCERNSAPGNSRKCSTGASDHLIYDLSAGRLQWPHAAPGQKPHLPCLDPGSKEY